MKANQSIQHCGYVALVGAPNVGKSTLLNRLIGEKLSITSQKSHTTRHRILGLTSKDNTQIIYLDTPGLHLRHKSQLQKLMNRALFTSLEDADIVLFVLDRFSWRESEELLVKRLSATRKPVFLIINKIDEIKDKKNILPHLKELSEKMTFAELIPVSAKKDINIDRLEECIVAALPAGPWLFERDQITDRNLLFLSTELIREQLFRLTNNELPYALTVEIERFALEDGLYQISALIWVEKESQKKIIIGTQGAHLKKIGSQARSGLERLLKNKVYLKLWVKIRGNWADDETFLSNH